MPKYFFFSYSRDNNDAYLQQFFTDLSEKVCEMLGIDKSTEVGFFDQVSLQRGDDWNRKLEEAIQTCPVMVSLYSPAYFNSEFCGKEWECFSRRGDLYVQKAPRTVSHPPVIKPVIWLPPRRDEDIPRRVRGPQYTSGNPDAPHNKRGLKDMRQHYGDYGRAYDDFIKNLASEILDTVEVVSLPKTAKLIDWLGMGAAGEEGLPALLPFPSWTEITNAFQAPLPVAAPPSSTQEEPLPRRRVGPKFVRYVVVAADPSEFTQGARRPDFYIPNGGVEWKPYIPDLERTLMSIAQETSAALDIVSDELLFDANLPSAVRSVENANSMVIIFVDTWTAELPRYGAVLRDIDQNKYLNCSIFVPWNDKDAETKAREDELRKLLYNTIFRRWSSSANLGEKIFFKDSIASVENLRDELRTTLRQLQTLIGKSVIDRATPGSIARGIQSDVPKPVLSHKDPTGGGTG